MLSKGPSRVSPARITVSVLAQPVEGGKWAIHLTTVSGDLSGERQLRAESCDEARRAVALLVALMINPDAHVVGSEPLAPSASTSKPSDIDAAPPSANNESPAAPAQTRTQTKGDAADAQLALRGYFGAELVGDNGALPSVDVGGRANIGLNARRWSLALRTGALARRSAEYPDVPNAGAKFNLYDTELAVCAFGVQQGSLALKTCAGPRLSVYHAASYGVTSPGAATKLGWGTFGELALRYAVARGVALGLGLEVLVSFQRPKFVIQDLGQVFQPGLLEERVSLGPEFEF